MTNDPTPNEALAILSHQLRTPLSTVLGFSELLLQDEQDPLSAAQRDALQEIRQAGERMLALIEALADGTGERHDAGRERDPPETP